MSSDDVHTSRCPTCRKVLPHRDMGQIPYFPFCSERCRMVDLGRWLAGEYGISAEKTSGEEEKKNS